MKIYRCRELLQRRICVPGGRSTETVTVEAGQIFTADDGQCDPVRIEGINGQLLAVSRKMLEKYFDELA